MPAHRMQNDIDVWNDIWGIQLDFGDTGIKADIISESTAGAGVTIDGLTIKDGAAGTVTAEGGSVYVGDSKGLYWGADQDASAVHDGTTGVDIALAANDSGALTIKRSTTNLLTFDTTTGANKLTSAVNFDIGASASVIGSGVTVSDTISNVHGVYGDDGGVAGTSAYHWSIGRFRMLTTATAANREQEISSVRAQLVQKQGTCRHHQSALTGSYEVNTGTTVDGQAWGTGPWFQCGVRGRVGAGSGITTLNSNGILAAFVAESGTTSFAANNGFYCGYFVGKTATLPFGYGIMIDQDAVTRGIYVGTLGSNITSGVPILNATSINGFYSDDNGADQTAGVYRNVTARTYFSVDQTIAAADYYAIRGHIKAASGIDFGGDTSVKACVNGYAEFAGATIIGAGSFFASVFGEFWGDGNITGTGKAAGVMARIYTSAGTTSGTTAAFMATKHFASTQNWPYGLYIDSATCDIRLANASGAGIYSKATTPNGSLTAPKGSICLVPNGSGANDRIYINTDAGTTWTSITCGA